MEHRILIGAIAASLLAACGGCGGPTPDRDGGTSGGEDSGSPLDDGGVQPGFDAGSRPDAAYQPLPLSIGRVLPARGPTTGATNVTVEGGNFYKNFSSGATDARKHTRIFFGSNEVSDYQIIDNDRIELRTPPNLAGAVEVIVKNPNGTARCAGCFTYYEEMQLLGLSPASGPLEGGTELTLVGQGFTTDVVVLVGGVASPKITFADAKTLKAITPPGAAPGLVDVRAFNKNGVSDLRRRFLYTVGTAITSVVPPGGRLSGANTVVVNGANFGNVNKVTFGGVVALVTGFSATSATVIVPTGTAAGPVDVGIETDSGNATLRGGYVYFDPAQLLSVAGVWPTHGPAAGGNVVTVVGTGFVGATFEFGGAGATVTGTPTDNFASVLVPAGAANSDADVKATAGASNATRAAGYHYNLRVSSVAPAVGPSAGGTAVTVNGAGFKGTLEVRFGALAGSSVVLSGPTSIAAVTPPGGGGPVDIIVRDVGDMENESRLVGGFSYDEPLDVARVQPEVGAVAGGTFVTVLGTGFLPGTGVGVGAGALRDVRVLDRNTITGRTPPGNAGAVDVTVKRGATTDVLPSGFTYFDPKSGMGGASGGPLSGTLNVTVLDATSGRQGAPIPDALVMLGTDPTTVFQGLTDARGQITFSDPSLIKPQQVTVSKAKYLRVTVLKQESENLTVYMFLNEGSGEPSFPPSPPPSMISGKVYGFKLPRPLTSNEMAWAEVWVAPSTLYACPPFGYQLSPSQRDARGEKWRITQEGGTYTIYSSRGYHAVYALFGIYDKSIQLFRPLYMGIARGVTTDPDNPATDIDIVLDMHLDQAVPVTVDNPPALPGQTASGVNNAYAYFELGGEGVICMSRISDASASFTLPYMPQVSGDAFVFFNQVTTSTGEESGYFRRQYGDLTQGVTLGPMLGLMEITTPAAGSSFTGTIAWGIGAGPPTDMYEVIFGKLTMFGLLPLWQAVVPGAEGSVTLPSNVLADIRKTLKPTDETAILLLGSRSPRFTFSHWNYNQIGFGGLSDNWTSYTYTGVIVGP